MLYNVSSQSSDLPAKLSSVHYQYQNPFHNSTTARISKLTPDPASEQVVIAKQEASGSHLYTSYGYRRLMVKTEL